MNRSSDAIPVKNLPPLPYSRKPLGSNLATVFIPESVGVVVGIKGEGVMQKLSLSEAESRGFITVLEQSDALFGVRSSMTIQIRSSRVRLAMFPKQIV